MIAQIRSLLPLLCATLIAGYVIPRSVLAANPPDGKLKLVVALFRHGVRAPLQDLGTNHSKQAWPSLGDWGAGKMGYLTLHGSQAVNNLGGYYGSYYSSALGNGFKAYLWADSQDQRTRATAEALFVGMQSAGVDVKVEYLQPPDTTDSLFHPFKANCGTPDTKHLQAIATYINGHLPEWLSEFTSPTRYPQLTDLYFILGCNNTETDRCQQPLKQIADHATAWSPPPTPTPRPSSPINWAGRFTATPNPAATATPVLTDGQFPYASTATEAFLLEYANGMDIEKQVGWGKVIDKKTGSTDKLCQLLALHEFYFDKTERELNKTAPDLYLAGIQGSNLVREIRDQLNKVVKNPPPGDCPRPSGDSQFVGLVGHDTNLANVQTLLNVKWSFDKDQQLPADIRNLPDNDALPAGALVFELRQTGPSDYKVRIQYVTQSLNQMRAPCEQNSPYRVLTTCGGENGKDVSPCEMSLERFNAIAGKVIETYNQFLSRCQDGKQVCP
jgi:Histidine phosphatase superfamily (branch 2)